MYIFFRAIHSLTVAVYHQFQISRIQMQLVLFQILKISVLGNSRQPCKNLTFPPEPVEGSVCLQKGFLR